MHQGVGVNDELVHRPAGGRRRVRAEDALRIRQLAHEVVKAQGQVRPENVFRNNQNVCPET
jgi:hypothetical protein